MNYIKMASDNTSLALIIYIIYEIRKVKDIIESCTHEEYKRNKNKT